MEALGGFAWIKLTKGMFHLGEFDPTASMLSNSEGVSVFLNLTRTRIDPNGKELGGRAFVFVTPSQHRCSGKA